MHPHLVDPAQAFLVVVDLQERYRGQLHEWDRTVGRCATLIRGAGLLDLPVICTEQYPRGLGPTAHEIRTALGDTPAIEKRTLSVLGEPTARSAISALGRGHAIVCGIETHACILQTVHDLLDLGLRVHVPRDAVSSRHASDDAAGYEKLHTSGAIGGSVESVLLECLRTADHPAFRAVQTLLK